MPNQLLQQKGTDPMNVHQINRQQPADWAPSPEQIREVLAALRNEAYPLAGRTGVGAAVRMART